jgi:hypothetical protein
MKRSGKEARITVAGPRNQYAGSVGFSHSNCPLLWTARHFQ